MTDDETIEIGCWAEALFDDSNFRLAVDQFEKHIFEHFMATDPKNKMEREGLYLQYQGAKDFLAHLRAYVEQKDLTLQRNELQALSQEDAQGDIEI